MTIQSFDGEHRFLSNFYPSEIEIDGIIYPSAENAYQAYKTEDNKIRQKIASMRNPVVCKRYAKTIALRDGWNDMRIKVMKFVVLRKFTTHKQLATKLLNTNDEELIEGNWWNDTFWGVCRGKGQNNLGKILMEIRKTLRDQQSS